MVNMDTHEVERRVIIKKTFSLNLDDDEARELMDFIQGHPDYNYPMRTPLSVRGIIELLGRRNNTAGGDNTEPRDA